MILALQSTESALTEEQAQYQFVVDTDLVHVGGGSAVLDY